ncbi:Lrp/AsnC family transcriptional regulator [Thermosulfurimonas sp. F29]|uniref:siroheme decarboxylase subunit beta n=1 Tax=Thermosulfurimonas sp. F29 TaxID=2867247 RepID=UPI001C834A74|nr:Lrp/AsnC family transcriptional regulator [Thermosulfurimonas sp. F29]MBX6422328.1 Lrp/AsnC family transcriptional regulator [Thermosulfurimonas sp. F29]
MGKGVELTELEKRLVDLLAEGLPLVERPFAKLAERLGVSEEEVLSAVRGLLKKRVIRRLGAIIRHDLSGYEGNVMVAWRVPEERVEEVGERLAAQPFITHCYLRRTYPDWPYNLYTMVHAESEEACRRLVEKLSRELDLPDYEMLFTEKEVVRRIRKYFS